MRQDEALETLLRQQAFEPPSDDFADRILARSAAMPQRRPVSFWQSLQRMFGELLPARPAYAFAALAVFGFVLGMNTNMLDDPSPDRQAYAYQDFDDDGGYL